MWHNFNPAHNIRGSFPFQESDGQLQSLLVLERSFCQIWCLKMFCLFHFAGQFRLCSIVCHYPVFKLSPWGPKMEITTKPTKLDRKSFACVASYLPTRNWTGFLSKRSSRSIVSMLFEQIARGLHHMHTYMHTHTLLHVHPFDCCPRKHFDRFFPFGHFLVPLGCSLMWSN